MPLEPISPVLHSMEFRLSYGDCDPAGIVYFAAYYQWMERIYSEWTYLGGFATSTMGEVWDTSLISRASGCEYFVPGLLFDAISCEMRVASVGITSFTMAFDYVRKSDGNRLAQGHIVFVFVDNNTHAAPIPDEYKAILRAAGADF
jgi:YbgC/YbaW family acyl-CoA thioester hydrolase